MNTLFKSWIHRHISINFIIINTNITYLPFTTPRYLHHTRIQKTNQLFQKRFRYIQSHISIIKESICYHTIHQTVFKWSNQNIAKYLNIKQLLIEHQLLTSKFKLEMIYDALNYCSFKILINYKDVEKGNINCFKNAAYKCII